MKQLSLLVVLAFFTSNIIEAQCISGDCIDGHGTWQWESGSAYTGEFENGTRNGYGQYEFSNGDLYIGEWRNNERDGYGVYYYNHKSNYEKYAGEWKKGQRHGIGIMHYDDKAIESKFGVWENNRYLYKYKEIGCLEGNCYKGCGIYVWNDGSRYEGDFKNGKRDGEGTYYYSKGAKYIGKQIKGKRNGWGTYYYESGSKYEGEWIEEKREGHGTMYSEGRIKNRSSLKEEGVVTNDKKAPIIKIISPKMISTKNQGQVLVVTKEKEIDVEGMVSDESGITRVRTSGTISELIEIDKTTKHFIGKIILSEGENIFWVEAQDNAGNRVRNEYRIRYDSQNNIDKKLNFNEIGCISGDCINGFGTWNWESGATYTGYFKNGTRNGYGYYMFSNSDVYVGDWQNNERHGYGVYHYNYHSGYKSYAGEWEKGQRSGMGIMHYDDENIASRFGIWKNNSYVAKYEKLGCLEGDCNQGYGLYVWNDGSRYEGDFKNGKRDGEGVYYYPKGAKYIGNQVNGKRNGEGTYYYPSGSKYVGEWKDEVRNGTATFYFVEENMLKMFEGIWENGQKQVETD